MKVTTLILGAGAAGLMAARFAGPGTLVVDHARSPGEKIRISGGGRCNFTNYGVEAARFLSGNPHFCKSALKRYTQWDFLDLVESYGIAWHEKTLGQLFCDGKATQIVDMLVMELDKAGADLWLRTAVGGITHANGTFRVALDREGRRVIVEAQNLVLATGGKSIPKMGATGLAYEIAQQFGLPMTDTRPGLVPFTFDRGRFADLTGISLPVTMRTETASFDEAMLFTHRGLSGPAVLQCSSYWHEGQDIGIALLPQVDLADDLRQRRKTEGRKALRTVMTQHLPGKLLDLLSQTVDLSGNVADLSDKRIAALSEALADWRLKPTGTEGYRTAEVTLGGIDTDALDSKTMMARNVPGLFAIGEAVDVTGWLGGYNFQWAWSSGAACGRAIAAQTTSA